MRILKENNDFDTISYEINGEKVVITTNDSKNLESEKKAINRFLQGSKSNQSAKIKNNDIIVDVDDLVKYALSHMFY